MHKCSRSKYTNDKLHRSAKKWKIVFVKITDCKYRFNMYIYKFLRNQYNKSNIIKSSWAHVVEEWCTLGLFYPYKKLTVMVEEDRYTRTK